jgi:hypothetical protein
MNNETTEQKKGSQSLESKELRKRMNEVKK